VGAGAIQKIIYKISITKIKKNAIFINTLFDFIVRYVEEMIIWTI